MLRRWSGPSRTDLVAKLSGNIVKDAADSGAKASSWHVRCVIPILICAVRRLTNMWAKKSLHPVIYLTQAIGLAVGVAPEKLGLQRHFVKVNTL
jgi:heterodisulfide reductase subunit B